MLAERRVVCSDNLQCGQVYLICLGIPLVTQSDPGTENNGMANCHTVPSSTRSITTGTIQHQWKFDKMNVKPEIWWSYLQTNFSPGFEDILDQGLTFGLYDPNDPLER
jgi:hypothetical protein